MHKSLSLLVDDLLKSQVKAHTRTTKTGKIVQVKAHTDKRQKKVSGSPLDHVKPEIAVAQHRIRVAAQEILADIKSGDVPKDVESFSELHDYVDANMYVNDANREDRMIGPLGKAKGWKAEEYANFTNKIIDVLDKWLKNGRHGEPKYTP